MEIRENYSLLAHNTFGIEARCRRFVTYDSVEELVQYLETEKDSCKPLFHIGGGSNLLFLGDFDGTILHSHIHDIQETPTGLRAGAAVVWDDFVAYSLAHGWYGLENLSLIPGEVGASAVQNIGAYGAEAKDFISEVECLNLETGQIRTFNNEECCYSYRQSIFKQQENKNRWAVLYVTFRLSRTFVPHLDYGGIRAELERLQISLDTLTAEQLRQVIIAIRRNKLPDPSIQGNAGSFFMNPIVSRTHFEKLQVLYPDMPHYDVADGSVKIPAAWMIEQCGWKGRALGSAAVHDRQALVLVNRGGATGQDIINLCETIRHDVRKRFDIDIHPEVNILP